MTANLLYIGETYKGRTGEVTNRAEEMYSRVFQLEFDSYDIGPNQVLAASGIPDLYQAYSSHGGDASARCRVERMRATQDEEYPYRWFVHVHYSARSEDQELFALKPTDRRPKRSLRFEERTVPIFQDVGGLPILNSALDYFDPPLESERFLPVLTIKRFEATLPVGLANQYRGAVNSDVFLGVFPGIARMTSISADEVHEEGSLYYEVSYEITFNPDTWAAFVLDQGYHEIVQVGENDQGVIEEKRIIRDSEGAPYQQPQLLDGNGGRLPDGADPVFLAFNRYPERPFSLLGLE